MQHSRLAILLAILAAILTLTVVSPSASAQQNQKQAAKIVPPQPSKEEEPSFTAQLFVLIVIGAAAVGVNLIPSKRGHQD